MGKTIIWTHQAEAQLNEAFLDLLEQSQSIETTMRVITEIYESVSILATNPRFINWMPSKKIIKETLGAYEKLTYRISYLIEEEAVYITRVRYARKEPLEY